MLAKKSGFTLVELLAVIVILVIILAITVPVISQIIKSAKRGAFASDVRMIITGIEYKALEASIDPINKTAPVPNDHLLTGIELQVISEYGGNPSNYDHFQILDTDPITIKVQSNKDSEFGAWYVSSATRNTFTVMEGQEP